MLFVCDVEGFALTFEDDHIFTAVNVFDMFKLRKLKGTPTICELEVYGRLVICHSLLENKGQSIVNIVETLALAACFEFDIDAPQLIWIEHHPEKVYKSIGGKGERWERVSFNITGNADDGYEFDEPRWEKITHEEVKLLISRYRPEENLEEPEI